MWVRHHIEYHIKYLVYLAPNASEYRHCRATLTSPITTSATASPVSRLPVLRAPHQAWGFPDSKTWFFRDRDR